MYHACLLQLLAQLRPNTLCLLQLAAGARQPVLQLSSISRDWLASSKQQTQACRLLLR
jgi:hypothetical protein